ncbi:hypothetical protein [Paucisalibacillus globulus]|uniref:hypothetical protein n=1 Tax=Paucisalibacillus globulus TaxID=351095 RepID=UPI000424F856|nr:hypothetical protein [Paucisalibacillus globulus]
MLVKNIEITKEVLTQWDKQLLPNYDIYFIPETHESLIKEFGRNALILPTNDFYNNTVLYTMDVINSYRIWQIDKSKLKYVCISHPSVITSLHKTIRDEIFNVQKEVNNGLVFEWNSMEDLLDASILKVIEPILEPFIFEDDSNQWLSIQQSLWGQLNQEVRNGFLLNFAKGFIDEVAVDELTLQDLKDKYAYLAPYFNSFGVKSGANCFSATVAAISGEDAEIDWIISNWVFEETLLTSFEANQYKKFSFEVNSLQPGDVLVWKNETGNIHHACFHMGDGYFFNKHGQTFFNPWQVLTLENLYEAWGKKSIDLYRKTNV